jgi:2'-hydroxyisoflavone reductase
MAITRRTLLQHSAAAGALCALPCRSLTQEKAKEPLDLLVLGGTGFIGPHIVEFARQRGHTLTLFNRGRTNPGLFPEIEKLHGDRNPDKGEGIAALADRRWDVVFDDCGYYPRHVKASAELLAKGGLGHYVYVSSISCYAKNDVEGGDESAELATMPDPTLESMGANYEYYGSLKALCEQAAEAALPERTTAIRPGYIVGPGDPTDRFTYWPVRIEKGGDVLVPGAPTDPIQVIDARDLARWMVHVAETSTFGVFNACGPKERLRWGSVIDACAGLASAEPTFHWAPSAKLQELLKPEDGDALPIWAAYEGDSRGFHTWSNARAVAAGLTFHPIEEIVKDTLAWWKSQPEDRRVKLRAGMTAEREAEILAALA